MKYFIIISCFVAMSLAQIRNNPECSWMNRPKVLTSDCCKGLVLIKVDRGKCEELYPITNSTERRAKFEREFLILQCSRNQTVIRKDGKIDAEVALALFTKNADSSLRTVIETAVDTCMTEDGGDERSSKGLKDFEFRKCVELNVYEGCPTDNKINSEECTQLTNFLEKCKPEKKD